MATQLPLSGAPLVLTLPPGEGQPTITFRGQIEDGYDGSVYDGRDADEGGSLFQISPGQWTLTDTHGPSHTYVFSPVGEVTGLERVSVQFDASQLVDAHLISPREVQANLSGSLEVSADLPTPPPPLSPLAIVGLIAALGAVLVLLSQLKGIWNRNSELRDLWSRCQEAAKTLKKIIAADDALSATAKEGLLTNLSALMVEAKALRNRIPLAEDMLSFYRGKNPKDDALRLEIKRLKDDLQQCWDGLRAIANTLEAQGLSLRRAMEETTGAEEAQAVKERLGTLQTETAAALAAKVELEGIARANHRHNR